ncbi:hypothetical protein KY092_17440 [Natronomonas gomsonensis]|nr:hypothetical protein [Natronomonas gomsonensis]MCY4732340.1 hypothetical protein [Natronomonas gomsonensis]
MSEISRGGGLPELPIRLSSLGDVVEQLLRYIFCALVDESGQILFDICSSIEGRKGPREDVTPFPEWLAIVLTSSRT